MSRKLTLLRTGLAVASVALALPAQVSVLTVHPENLAISEDSHDR